MPCSPLYYIMMMVNHSGITTWSVTTMREWPQKDSIKYKFVGKTDTGVNRRQSITDAG